MTKKDLFLELAKPDRNGVSRWVNVKEFTGKYKDLQLGNGGSWCRKESSLAKQYMVEFDKELTSGNGIDAIRLNGFLGTSNPEVDHKDGRKNDERVMLNQDQQLSDFQPLSKAANDAKRQYCKDCKSTNLRYDAAKLGYPISFYKGTEHYDDTNKCIGCFWYDPIEFRKHLKEK